jgi:hypothetical protein
VDGVQLCTRRRKQLVGDRGQLSRFVVLQLQLRGIPKTQPVQIGNQVHRIGTQPPVRSRLFTFTEQRQRRQRRRGLAIPIDGEQLHEREVRILRPALVFRPRQ